MPIMAITHSSSISVMPGRRIVRTVYVENVPSSETALLSPRCIEPTYLYTLGRDEGKLTTAPDFD